jgi:hypothetical protein
VFARAKAEELRESREIIEVESNAPEKIDKARLIILMLYLSDFEYNK